MMARAKSQEEANQAKRSSCEHEPEIRTPMTQIIGL